MPRQSARAHAHACAAAAPLQKHIFQGSRLFIKHPDLFLIPEIMARRAIKRALLDSGIEMPAVKKSAKKLKVAKPPKVKAEAKQAKQAKPAKLGASGPETTGPLDMGAAESVIQSALRDFDLEMFESQLKSYDMDIMGSSEPALPRMFSAGLDQTGLVRPKGPARAPAAPAPTESAEPVQPEPARESVRESAEPALESALESALEHASETVETSDLESDSAEDAETAQLWKLDDYIDYESMCEDSGSEEESAPASPVPSERSIPLFSYRDRNLDSRLPDIPYNTRRFQAAWSLVAQDIDPSSRTAYLQNLFLAAASLKQSSIASGLARQTMAPALVPF